MLMVVAIGGVVGYLFVEATVKSIKKFIGF